MEKRSVPVSICLEWTSLANTNVIGLLLCQLGQAGSQSGQVKAGNLLIQRLGQQVHIVLVCLVGGVIPVEIDLSQSLIGERARHDERRMACGATKIQQTACCQDND